MSLFSLRCRAGANPRAVGSLVWPLGALLWAAGTPARAQEATPTTPDALATPQLTAGARPTSSIAASVRPKISSGRATGGHALLMAAPTPLDSPSNAPRAAAIGTPQKTSPPPVKASAAFAGGTADSGVVSSAVALSSNMVPQTLISPAKRIRVTTKSRFAASRVSAHGTQERIASLPALAPVFPGRVSVPPLAPSPMTSSPMTSALPVAPSPNSATVSAMALVPEVPAAASPRDRMARLPSRGGSIVNRSPLELRPSSPALDPISDSQRLLLSKLDADLGRAQIRLDRADSRLTEGQRQLATFTDALRSAMLDNGDDGRGLHPFVRVAQRYLGTPYVWGGESARGFDCSGFIMRVMRDLGYRALPHSAAEQFRYGMPVARALLKPGDLVFFANTYKPGVSHVGIYLGRGRFINAANSKVGTIVSGLNEPKWLEHYAGARRLLPVNS